MDVEGGTEREQKGDRMNKPQRGMDQTGDTLAVLCDALAR